MNRPGKRPSSANHRSHMSLPAGSRSTILHAFVSSRTAHQIGSLDSKHIKIAVEAAFQSPFSSLHVWFLGSQG